MGINLGEIAILSMFYANNHSDKELHKKAKNVINELNEMTAKISFEHAQSIMQDFKTLEPKVKSIDKEIEALGDVPKSFEEKFNKFIDTFKRRIKFLEDSLADRESPSPYDISRCMVKKYEAYKLLYDQKVEFLEDYRNYQERKSKKFKALREKVKKEKENKNLSKKILKQRITELRTKTNSPSQKDPLTLLSIFSNVFFLPFRKIFAKSILRGILNLYFVLWGWFVLLVIFKYASGISIKAFYSDWRFFICAVGLFFISAHIIAYDPKASKKSLS